MISLPRRSACRAFPAFTLIELLIVLAILGVLASIVIPQFAMAREDAARVGAEAAAREVQKAVYFYREAHGTLPDLTTSWTPLTTRTTTAKGKEVGPFLMTQPVNLLCPSDHSRVVDGTGELFADQGAFVYDYAGGSGTGRLLAAQRRP